MSFLDTLPQTQGALTLVIVLSTFVYEDGATLLAAALSASGRLDPRIGLLAAFLGIWIGDIGLYRLGSLFGRRTVSAGWLQRLVQPARVARAERWFARHGSFALVISRAIPGSRLPIYVAAGVLRLPTRLFARITAACAAVWVLAIFAFWWHAPSALAGHGRVLLWMVAASLLAGPWLLGKSVSLLWRRLRRREAAALCAL